MRSPSENKHAARARVLPTWNIFASFTLLIQHSMRCIHDVMLRQSCTSGEPAHFRWPG